MYFFFFQFQSVITKCQNNKNAQSCGIDIATITVYLDDDKLYYRNLHPVQLNLWQDIVKFLISHPRFLILEKRVIILFLAFLIYYF